MNWCEVCQVHSKNFRSLQVVCLVWFQGFEHLLQNLGLGRLVFEESHSLSLHKVNGSFREVHDSMRLHRHGHDQSSASSKRNRREVEGTLSSSHHCEVVHKTSSKGRRKCKAGAGGRKTKSIRSLNDESSVGNHSNSLLHSDLIQILMFFLRGRRGSSVNILALAYGLDDQCSIPGKAEPFSSLQRRVQLWGPGV